jgi:hypothetical protein
MTDDLQGDVTVFEECTQNRFHSLAISGNHPTHHDKIKICPASLAILPDAIALNIQVLIIRIAPTVYFSTSFLFLGLLPSRAPPLSV